MVARTGAFRLKKKTALDERKPERVAGMPLEQQYIQNIRLERALRRRRYFTVRIARERALVVLRSQQQILEELISAGAPGIDEAREAVRVVERNVVELRALEARFLIEDGRAAPHLRLPVPLRLAPVPLLPPGQ